MQKANIMRAVAGLVLVCAAVTVGMAGHHSGVAETLRSTWGGSVLGLAQDAWLPVKDPQTGRTYWYNPLLRQTSWSNPAGPGQEAASTYTYDEHMHYAPVQPEAAFAPQAGAASPQQQPQQFGPAVQPSTQEAAAWQAQAAAAAAADPVVQAMPAAAMQGDPIVPMPAAPVDSTPPPQDPLLDRTHECPGSFAFGGVGDVHLVNAKWNQPGDPGGVVTLRDGAVRAQLKGRSYFAETCTPDQYDNNQYLNLQLLGRTIRYTTDLSAALCGCNAALYLSSMRQHTDESMCFDYYCDASSVCSGTCAEVDLQEANNRAWFSTMHMSGDSQGLGGGYGFGRKDWNASVYGPGARCIDTNRAFEVAISFPVDQQGVLEAMEVRLTQGGSPCPEGLFSRVLAASYKYLDRSGKSEVSEALALGMTPIVSYWNQPGDDGMGWMDGLGSDPEVPGPCTKAQSLSCGEMVIFSNFVLEDFR